MSPPCWKLEEPELELVPDELEESDDPFPEELEEVLSLVPLFPALPPPEMPGTVWGVALADALDFDPLALDEAAAFGSAFGLSPVA